MGYIYIHAFLYLVEVGPSPLLARVSPPPPPPPPGPPPFWFREEGSDLLAVIASTQVHWRDSCPMGGSGVSQAGAAGGQ